MATMYPPSPPREGCVPAGPREGQTLCTLCTKGDKDLQGLLENKVPDDVREDTLISVLPVDHPCRFCRLIQRKGKVSAYGVSQQSLKDLTARG